MSTLLASGHGEVSEAKVEAKGSRLLNYQLQHAFCLASFLIIELDTMKGLQM